jgi:hypothetical protein
MGASFKKSFVTETETKKRKTQSLQVAPNSKVDSSRRVCARLSTTCSFRVKRAQLFALSQIQISPLTSIVGTPTRDTMPRKRLDIDG